MEAWKERKQAARDWQNEDLKPDGLVLESKHGSAHHVLHTANCQGSLMGLPMKLPLRGMERWSRQGASIKGQGKD